MKVTLIVTHGRQAPREYHFTRHDTLLVGRSAEAHISVPNDKAFSRNHFLIEISPPRCFVHDLDSSNGTFVNDVQIQDTMLQHNDIIRAGETRVKVVMDDPATVMLEMDALAPPPTALRDAAPMSPESALLALKSAKAVPKTSAGAKKKSPRGASGVKPAAQAAPPSQAAQPSASPSQSGDTAGAQRFRGSSVLIDAYGLPQVEIPGHELKKEIARGGMGVIYLGKETASRRPVAIKMIVPQYAMLDSARKMFLREVEVLSKLRHPGIVKLTTFGSVAEVDYYVMEFVEGRNLDEYLREHKAPLPAAEALYIACQVLDALEYAHQGNIVHRDLKPGNIMISRERGKLRARVLDFGLAKNYEEAGSLTLTGEFKGTLMYVAPEQILDCKNVGPRSDLFALGAILYFLLTRQPLYDVNRGQVADMIKAILDGKIVPVEQRGVKLPRPLQQALAKSLAHKAANRYQTAAEMKHALEIAMTE